MLIETLSSAKAVLFATRIVLAAGSVGLKYACKPDTVGQTAAGKFLDVLSDLGLNMGAGVATTPLEGLLSKDRAAAEQFTNHHLAQYSGQVLQDLVRLFIARRTSTQPMKEKLRQDKELEAFAKKVPAAWQEFLQRHHQIAKALGAPKFVKLLAESFQATGKGPVADPADFIGFFNSVHVLASDVKPELAKWLSKNLDHALKEGLVGTSETAVKAYKKTLLQFHSVHHEALADISKNLDKTRRGVVAVRKEQKQQGRVLKNIDKKLEKIARISALSRYKLALQNEFRFIEALHVPPPKEAKLREKWNAGGPLLTEAFVPPPCCVPHHELPEFNNLLQQYAAKPEGDPPWQPFLPELAEHRRIVLLADPGMGKSTLIRYLISGLAQDRRPRDIPAELKDCIPFPFIMRDIVPRLIDLEPNHEQWTWPLLLDAFKQWCPAKKGLPVVRESFSSREDTALLEEYFESKHAFFLIDGLDEVGNETLRKAIQRVIIEGYTETNKDARFLITSRVIGYDAAQVHRRTMDYAWSNISDYLEETIELNPVIDLARGDHAFELPDRLPGHIVPSWLLFHARLIHLAPFSDEHQQKFAQYWFGKRLNHSNALGSTEGFLEAICKHPSVHIISRCPYVLLLLTVVYHEDLRLPDGRAQVYARLADIYLEKIDDDADIKPRLGPIASRSTAQKKKWLEVIAMHMQRRRTESEEASASVDHAQPVYRATADDIVGWLEPVIDATDYANKADAARAFAQYLGERTGLFLPREQSLFEWMHNSFMEFFAAMYLQDELRHADDMFLDRMRAERSRKPFNETDYLARHPAGPIPVDESTFEIWAADPRWHEVIIFLMENLGQSADTAQVDRVLEYLFPALNEEAGAAPSLQTQDEKWSPLLPLETVELLAKLAWDGDLRIPQETRQRWWRRLWAAKLGPDTRGLGPWSIAPKLLARVESQEEVLTALKAACRARPEIEAIKSPYYFVDLSDCTTLTNKALGCLAGLDDLRLLILNTCSALQDIEALADLPALRHIQLDSCTGLRNEAFRRLAGLRQLQWLSLSGCTGLKDLQWLMDLPSLSVLYLDRCSGLRDQAAFQGLGDRRQLEFLSLSLCTGLADTQPLKGLTGLTQLHLKGCTGLHGATAFHGLGGLKKLESLSLSDCTGLEDTQPLAGITNLKNLFLDGCTGLPGRASLHGLAGLKNLEHLVLSRSSGLKQADVDWLQGELGEGCKIEFVLL